MNTFTATGPVCPSGTFVKDVHTAAGQPDQTSKVNLLIRTVYTCDDGSGTFFALKHAFITFEGEGSSSNDGLITLHGGTGDFVGLNGHGHDVGSGAGDFGTAQITGVVIGS